MGYCEIGPALAGGAFRQRDTRKVLSHWYKNTKDVDLKSITKKTICALLAVLLLIPAAAGCGNNAKKEDSPLTVAIRSISKHGNVVLDISFDEMRDNNMDVGDVITVTVGDNTYDIPVGTAFSDVDSGNMICRFDLEDDEVAVAINMGSFAKEAGIGEKQTIEADPGYKWDVKISEVGLLLKEKAGYLDEYNARNVTRTDAREDYVYLSDEEFANFRAVSVSGMKENALYRSSTPLEPAIGRNEYAMAAMEKAGIRSVIDLDDSAEVMRSYESFPGSYYSGCAVINPEMNYDFGSEEFGQKVRESILFIIENDGPYLIHCKEGKDRTGILCAIIECFVGTSREDVMKDYMITYSNYYGVQPEDATYGIILKNNLVKTLCELFKADDLENADLKEKAEEYLLSTGLTEEQLGQLTEKLGEKQGQLNKSPH